MIVPLALFAMLGPVVQAAEQADLNYAVNGGFETGLQGWTIVGRVAADESAPISGKASAVFGPGRGALRQKYVIGGLQIMEFGATARSTDSKVDAQVRVKCLDKHNRVLMDLKQSFDPKKLVDPKGVGTGIYFKTHAFTDHVEVSIEKTTSSQAKLSVDSVELKDYDKGRIQHAPLCDLAQYMQPIWQGKTVYNETALLVSQHGEDATGALLYRPSRVISVRDSKLQIDYQYAKDYGVNLNSLVSLPASQMTTLKGTDFPSGDYPWLSVAGKHVVVSYIHEDNWAGPTPKYVGDQLPATMAKLVAKKPVTIVALGDSITLGINVSGYRNEPPFMPPWVDLFAWKLGKIYENERIKLYNTGLGGMTSQWGMDNAQSAVASLNPDLVLIGFGMNDFWSVGPEEFRKHIEATMSTIRKKRPRVEFILIGSMLFDPIYTTDPVYVGHINDYAKQLHTLEAMGVQVLDMTALTSYLYKTKDAKGLMADPMHPDDFLARIYAQALVSMLDKRPI